MIDMDGNTRCSWVTLKNPLYVRYHDEEWGIPLYDDKKLFELFVLETFQAGLSWECVLNKRDHFRKAFDGFEPDLVMRYGEEKIEELMKNPGIIRNRRKIKAAIINSRIFQSIQEEFGSFSNYIWSYTSGNVVREPFTLRTTSPLSDAISKDLKKRGMSFVGSTTIYAFLQSMGVIAAHSEGCICCGRSGKKGMD